MIPPYTDQKKRLNRYALFLRLEVLKSDVLRTYSDNLNWTRQKVKFGALVSSSVETRLLITKLTLQGCHED